MSFLRPYAPAIFILSLLLTFFAVWPPAQVEAQQGFDVPLVQEVRVGRHGDTTRIVLEFASDVLNKPEYYWFTLPEPARVVLDFTEVRFAQPLNDVELPDNSLVKGMRAGLFRPGTTRMVLDLAKGARVNVFALPVGARGHRLVIDVGAVGKGQVATNVPPPADVVTFAQAPAAVPAEVTTESKKANHRVMVTLDPGHGGVDPGGCGKGGLCEKGLVLEVGKLVRERLARKNIDVVMTRDTDIFIPLAERVRIGQRAQSDLFVSLHADIHPTNRSVSGATVYMVSEKASDKEAARLAKSENAGDILAGVALQEESREVQGILLSLVQRETMNGSSYLAQSLIGHLDAAVPVRKKSPLFAGFRVLKAPDVPSVLVELGYLSNPREEKLMRTKAYREKLADAVAQGILAYVQRHVHK